MSNRMHSVGPFLLGETIGRGSIGRVKLAVHKETGFKVAIKIVDKEKITEVNPHLLQKIEREIVLMVRIT
jgi:5'-AMP-activated protein kinase catalytic alpha subunit